MIYIPKTLSKPRGKHFPQMYSSEKQNLCCQTYHGFSEITSIYAQIRFCVEFIIMDYCTKQNKIMKIMQFSHQKYQNKTVEDSK